ncbi:unnamed protein product [Meloidogyne enterolobii]|uniref:Uncharacterized protein n=1 Tax=Meloidogyne enterolobii TaxID=390850 RepID=A0ACB0YDS8_MELEN
MNKSIQCDCLRMLKNIFKKTSVHPLQSNTIQPSNTIEFNMPALKRYEVDFNRVVKICEDQ